MKKIVLILIALSACISSTLGQVRVSNMQVVRNGNRAEISFDARIGEQATDRNHKLVLTPIIYNGEKSAELPSIEVQTRRTRIMDKRNRVTPLPGTIATSNGKALHYTTTTYFQSWMQGSNIRLDVLKEGCCSERRLPSMDIAQNIDVIDPDLLNIRVGDKIMILNRNPALSDNSPIAAAAQPEAQISSDNKFDLVFERGHSNLVLTIDDNYRALTNVINLLGPTRVLVGKIEVTGFASPDGPQAFNDNLAHSRAIAVRDHLLNHISWLRASDFEIINGGENWEGLHQLVANSKMTDSKLVLNIIGDTSKSIDPTKNAARKKQLMELNRGITWNYMMKNLFPELRNATASITYNSTTKEMELERVIERNADIINRAIDLISERKGSQALSILSEITYDPRAWNPMGVAYLLGNDKERAKHYFQMAADAGYREAKSNLGEISNN